MHGTSNIFGHSAATIGGLGVSLNYPILNLKKKVCPKMSGCSTVMHIEEDFRTPATSMTEHLFVTIVNVFS